MIYNSLKLIIRSFFRNKFYALSLIAGFTLSFATAGILLIFLLHEFNTDGFHRNHNNIYRVLMNDPITLKMGPITSHQLSERLKQNFPEIKNAIHIYYPGRTFVSTDPSISTPVFKEEAFLYTDTEFFEIFDFNLILGNKDIVLNGPKSIVLTRSAAEKYFGDFNVLGKNLYIKGEPFVITGLLDDIPSNSHLNFTALVSKSSLPKSDFPLDYVGLTYILMNPKSAPEDLEYKMSNQQKLLLPYVSDQEFKKPFNLQPLKEVYFHNANNDAFLKAVIKSRDYSSLKIFGGIACVILILSLFNYVNFSQSKALFYFKENLVNRIFGAPQHLPRLQFILEALLVVLVSLALSFVMIFLFIGIFNDLMGSSLPLKFLSDVQVVGLTICFAIVVSIMLGLSADIFAAKINKSPMRSGKPQLSGGRLKILNAVFLVQLVGSLVLAAFTLLVMNQIHFIKQQPPGYTVENVVEIDLSSLPAGQNPQTVKEEYNKLPQVLSSTVCTGGPLTGRMISSIKVKDARIQYSSYTGDVDLIATLGFEVLHGRTFNPGIASDTNAVLVNESAYKLLSLDENYAPLDPEVKLTPKNVIGVIKNFHYQSLRDEIGPVIIGYSKFNKTSFLGTRLVVRSTALDSAFLRNAEAIWKKFQTSAPFEYTVSSQKYSSLHETEFKQSDLFLFGASISLIICVFGLVGLSFFNAQKRAKEVAMRKVLGATPLSIAAIFLLKLSKTVVMAAVIALPVVLYTSEKWMTQFKYKTPLSWKLLLLLVVSMLLIMVVSVAYQLIKVIRQNPAKTLKYE